MTEHALLILIPCFNESSRFPLAEYHAYLEKTSPSVQLRFVNDGSTDQTQQLIGELATAFPNRVSFLELPKNVGKAEAIRQGILNAKENVDYLGYWDADLATPLQEIDHLYAEATAYHNPSLVIGSRIKLLGTTEIKRYWFRHYFGRLFATLVSTMLGVPVYDTQCGAKLIRADQVALLFSTPFLSKWLFDVEVIFRLLPFISSSAAKTEIIEVPLKKWTEKGASKLQFFYLFKVPFELALIFIKNRKYRNR
jgi:dolichyl-phosphate beta-glucosyltransferase